MPESFGREDRLRELKINTLIIAIANIGSKAIALMLAPLYSYYLSVEQYGIMDLVTSTVSLIAPLFCLDIYEATFRYANDEGSDGSKVLSTSLAVCIPGMLICILSTCCLVVSGKTNTIYVYITVFVVLESVSAIFAQFLRGSGDLISFAVGGILNSLVLLISNIVFVVLIRYELRGWMISFLSGHAAMLIYTAYKSLILCRLSFEKVDRKLAAGMLRYCIPLLPAAMMWWIMNASDRYMIRFFLGVTANGIYAVANKIPSIISIFERIFYQAFQTSAIRESENSERNLFYSKVFNNYCVVLAIGVSCLLVVLKPAIVILFDKKFSSAWMSAGVLSMAVILHALAGNLGSYYVTFKETQGALYTSMIGAMTNITLNFLFIPRFGIMGAALTTLMGYAVTLIVRWFGIRKYVRIRLEYRRVIITGILLGMIFALFFRDSFMSFVLRVFVLMMLLYRERVLLIRIIAGRN